VAEAACRALLPLAPPIAPAARFPRSAITRQRRRGVPAAGQHHVPPFKAQAIAADANTLAVVEHVHRGAPTPSLQFHSACREQGLKAPPCGGFASPAPRVSPQASPAVRLNCGHARCPEPRRRHSPPPRRCLARLFTPDRRPQASQAGRSRARAHQSAPPGLSQRWC